MSTPLASEALRSLERVFSFLPPLLRAPDFSLTALEAKVMTQSFLIIWFYMVRNSIRYAGGFGCPPALDFEKNTGTDFCAYSSNLPIQYTTY